MAASVDQLALNANWFGSGLTEISEIFETHFFKERKGREMWSGDRGGLCNSQ